MRHMFRGREVAGYWEPATPRADLGRPGRLRVSLWLKGPAARGPYWRLSWVTSRPTWLQCRAGRGDGWPVRRPVAMPVPGFGGSGLYCGHTPSYRRAVGTVLVGAVLAGFWEPAFFAAGLCESAFFMAGFWESVLLGPAPWSWLSRIFLGGGF